LSSEIRECIFGCRRALTRPHTLFSFDPNCTYDSTTHPRHTLPPPRVLLCTCGPSHLRSAPDQLSSTSSAAPLRASHRCTPEWITAAPHHVGGNGSRPRLRRGPPALPHPTKVPPLQKSSNVLVVAQNSNSIEVLSLATIKCLENANFEMQNGMFSFLLRMALFMACFLHY
jgi:hypothetical protein